jgi:protein phosphatase
MLSHGLTHTPGTPSRPRNQDGYGAFPDLGLFVVADGFGSLFRGDEAAMLVVRETSEAYGRGERSCARLVAAVEAANASLHSRVRNVADWACDGACLVALAIVGSDAHVAHVGDCRLYRWRRSAMYRSEQGHWELLTKDHSLLNDVLEKRQLPPEQIAAVPKSAVTRALGLHDAVMVDSRTEAISAGDLFVLASNGLYDAVDESRMAKILAASRDAREVAAALMDAARRAATRDDATVLVVQP